MRLGIIQRRDPYWGDGPTTRHRRTRRRVVSMLAATLAVVAVLAVGIVGALGVRAAGLSVNLDQWASTDAAWQNGNLNGNNSRYPDIVRDFEATFATLRSLACDIFFAPHGGQFAMAEKFARLERREKDPFVDPEGWKNLVATAEKAFRDQLAVEQSANP